MLQHSSKEKSGIQDGWNHYLERRLRTFPIYVSTSQPGHTWSLPRHRQPGIEINITHSGRAQLSVNRHRYPQSDRQIAAFSGACVHDFAVDCSLPYSRTVVCIEDSLFYALLRAKRILPSSATLHAIRNDYHEFDLDPQQWQALEELCDALVATYRQHQPWWQEVVIAQTSDLIATLFGEGEVMATDAAPEADWLDQCRRYIQRNLDQELSLQAVSKRFYVSPEHLTRTFRKAHGLSFMGYVQQERIKAACSLLAETNLPIMSIACAVGYQSRSHFHRMFKAAVGMTPNEYRERMGR